MAAGNNKRIAKNAVLLYVRMIFGIIVSLYTSRVVLNTLGVEDYGIYNVVGGVVAMFSVLNASMSGATSRFIAFELGRDNFVRLKKTFSSALIVHIAIAIVFLILAETIGLWFVANKLLIPEARVGVAHLVYQLSIFSAMVSITQVPYDACIIAHEKMDVYAYVEILQVSLKLVIVYVLLIGDFDKLALYAILMFAVSVLVLLINRIYCIRKFKEVHFSWNIDKQTIKPLLAFSGWDMYGCMSVVCQQQGGNVLLNMFIGPLVNASVGVAGTVNVTMSRFGYIILTAFKPQIIKQYAAGELNSAFALIENAAKYSLLLMWALCLPLIIEMPFVLFVWLGQVPEYVVPFCRIILVATCVSFVGNVANTLTHATGRIKMQSIIMGTIYFACVPVYYLLLKSGFSAVSIFVFNLCIAFISVMVYCMILKSLVREFSVWKYLYNGALKSYLCTLIVAVVLLPIFLYLPSGWLRLFLSYCVSLASFVIISYLFMIDEGIKQKIKLRIGSLSGEIHSEEKQIKGRVK